MHYIARKIYLTCDETTVYAWAHFLRDHADEAALSLHLEKVAHELCYLGTDDQGLYIIGIMDIDPADLAHSKEITEQSDLSINEVHRAFKKHFGTRETLDLPSNQVPHFPDLTLLFEFRPKPERL